ncbi:hypothetical protein MTO96_009968 [Rhipicephalus appendiculatus]
MQQCDRANNVVSSPWVSSGPIRSWRVRDGPIVVGIPAPRPTGRPAYTWSIWRGAPLGLASLRWSAHTLYERLARSNGQRRGPADVTVKGKIDVRASLDASAPLV